MTQSSENLPLQEPGIAAPQQQEGDVKPILFDLPGRYMYMCTQVVTICDVKHDPPGGYMYMCTEVVSFFYCVKRNN